MIGFITRQQRTNAAGDKSAGYEVVEGIGKEAFVGFSGEGGWPIRWTAGLSDRTVYTATVPHTQCYAQLGAYRKNSN